jgi:hypothetical protein
MAEVIMSVIAAIIVAGVVSIIISFSNFNE